MVFEASCWVSGPLGANNTFNNATNPIQRRTKIDFFDPNTVNATSVISHISSNGYYGYCPTPVPATIQSTAAIVHTNTAECTDSDMTADATMCDLAGGDAQQMNQGQFMTTASAVDNRKRQYNNDMPIDLDVVKRRRTDRNIDLACDDVQMCDMKEDHQFGAADTSDTATWIDDMNDENAPANHDHHTNILHRCTTLTPTKKTTIDTKTICITDAENLYWHTHGSLPWQL